MISNPREKQEPCTEFCLLSQSHNRKATHWTSRNPSTNNPSPDPVDSSTDLTQSLKNYRATTETLHKNIFSSLQKYRKVNSDYLARQKNLAVQLENFNEDLDSITSELNGINTQKNESLKVLNEIKAVLNSEKFEKISRKEVKILLKKIKSLKNQVFEINSRLESAETRFTQADQIYEQEEVLDLTEQKVSCNCLII